MRIGNGISKLNRRDFIRTVTGVAALGAAAGPLAKNVHAAEQATVNGLLGVVFGRTGYKVTRIAFGGILVTDPPVLMQAIDYGFNLVHVSPGYQNGNSIKCFGEVMKTRRDKVVLALKVKPDEALDKGLKTLNTDHVEIIIPPMDSVEEISDPGLCEQFEAAKKAGKCAHMGFACHTQDPKIIDTAVKLGFYDVILMSYADTSNAAFMASLGRAREAGVAIMAMKGLPKRADAETAAHDSDLYASLCSSMVNNHATTVLATMGNHQAVEMYREILNKRLGLVVPALERRYWAEQQGNYCGMCGKCRGLCPNGVEVATIVRYRMYDRDYRMHDYARAKYAALGDACNGTKCEECGLCESQCSRALPLRRMISEAHALLA